MLRLYRDEWLVRLCTLSNIAVSSLRSRRPFLSLSYLFRKSFTSASGTPVPLKASQRSVVRMSPVPSKSSRCRISRAIFGLNSELERLKRHLLKHGRCQTRSPTVGMYMKLRGLRGLLKFWVNG